MKNLLRLMVLLLFVLNFVGLIWLYLLPWDDNFSSILLSETETTLKSGQDESNLAPPSPEFPANNSPASQTRENAWQAEMENFKATFKKSEAVLSKLERNKSTDKYEAAVRIQSMLVKGYAHKYCQYRTASYFGMMVHCLNAAFLLFVAVVMENLFAQKPCAEQTDDNITHPDSPKGL